MNNIGAGEIRCKTVDLNFFQKALQVYWVNPSSWLLDEFTVTDGVLTVVRKNGDRFVAPISEVEATIAVDNYDRREINLKCGLRKSRFKEIPGMLSEEEWDAIINLLSPRKSGLGKLNDALRDAKDKLEKLGDD